VIEVRLDDRLLPVNAQSVPLDAQSLAGAGEVVQGPGDSSDDVAAALDTGRYWFSQDDSLAGPVFGLSYW
jgi:hypothetical protein